jgi:hypothetical protein
MTARIARKTGLILRSWLRVVAVVIGGTPWGVAGCVRETCRGEGEFLR